ncbi:DNA-methyltransferase [Desulfurobacterium crinifex]
MEYLKGPSVKELKIRLRQSVYEKLKELQVCRDKSLNKLINDLLEEVLLSEKSKSWDLQYFFSEKPIIAFDKENICLYNNDFITVDLNKYKDSVDLIVTSPPYNLAIEYGKHRDDASYEEYLGFTELWLKKALFLLKEGGRLCLNVPLDKNKNGLKPVYADIVKIARDVGFGYQSTIVWNEQNISRRTAWGSWLSASAPYVIAPVEMIVLLYKGHWKKKEKGESTITKEEFIEWTNGVWTFPGESKKRIGHPAPFPLELPRRCIRMFSYKGDVILDPFVGSGTTLIAAFLEGRKGIGIELDEDYVKLAVRRISEEIKAKCPVC